MEGWFEPVVQRLGQLPAPWAYALLGLSAFLENVVPPVPGDMVVVFSAYLAGRGVLSWVPVYVVTCLGGTAGFLVMYAIGRFQGRAWLHGSGPGQRLRALAFPPERLQRAEGWLRRHGPWLVLGNRFLTGVRSVIAMAAGLGGLSWATVAGLGLLSMAMWNGLLLYAGLTLGENWDRVVDLLGRYNRALAVVVAAGLAVIAVGRLVRRRRAAARGGPEEDRAAGH